MIRALVALSIALTAPPAAGGCMPHFGASERTLVGGSIAKIVAANIDGDSYPDLVIARDPSSAEGGITVLLGRPDGSWVNAALDGIPDRTQAADVVALDFDDDGDDDLAWMERGQSRLLTLRVLRNDGGVRLTETASFDTAGAATGLARGDINADDLDDLVYVDGGTGHLFLSRGDGTFEQKTFGEDLKVPAATADLDGDGRDEVLTGTYAAGFKGNLVIFPGTTAGLGAPRSLALPFPPDAIAVGDFDGDGRVDASVGYTLFYMGTGLPYSRPYYDVDVVSDAGSTTATLKHAPLTVETRGAAVADVDGDGRDDLVAGAPGGVNVIAGQADGTFAIGAGYYTAAYNGIAAADFDGDGDVDVATAGLDAVTLLRNDGTGSLGDQRFAAIALDIADFNGDGRDDLLDATGVRVAGPGGTFTRSTETLQDDVTRPLVPWAAAADVNGDGKLDSVLQRIVPNRPTKLEVRLGNGDGTLLPATEVLEYFNVPREGTVVDLNADGKPDIVVTEVSGATHVVYGNGDGTFQNPVGSVPDGDEVELGDFNGDGRLDVLTVSPPAVNVTLGTSPGGFGPATKITETLTAVATGDFDGDGRTDFVTTRFANAKTTVRVFFGRADGTFEEKTFDGGPREYRDLLVADLNADERLDILLDGAVRRLLSGRPDRAFLGVDVESTHGGTPLQAGDFNGDGRTDLLDGGFVRLNRCARRRATRP